MVTVLEIAVEMGAPSHNNINQWVIQKMTLVRKACLLEWVKVVIIVVINRDLDPILYIINVRFL